MQLIEMPFIDRYKRGWLDLWSREKLRHYPWENSVILAYKIGTWSTCKGWRVSKEPKIEIVKRLLLEVRSLTRIGGKVDSIISSVCNKGVDGS